MAIGNGRPVSTPGEMSPLEAMMWRAEVDPRLRSPVVIVDILDTAPDWERLVAAHEWATRFVPRLRERVVEPWGGWGSPTWVPDPDFALPMHLRREGLAGPAGRRELLDVAEKMAMAPFDRARPPWEARVVTGLDGDRAAYLLKVHHSLADGLGLVQILRLLHSAVRAHTDDKPDHPTPGRDGPSRLRLTARQVLRTVGEGPSRSRDLLRNGVDLLGRLATAPVSTLADCSAFLGSAVRAAVGPTVPRSPVLAARSINRRFETLDVDLAELKEAGRAASGSVNDAFLAALLGGMRRYLGRFGPIPGRLAIGMPINTRADDDPLGGNHWAGSRFAAPLDDDPAARIASVRRTVRAVTGERVVDGLGLIAPLLAVLPSPLLARVQGGATSGNDLQASNILGLAGPAFLAGAQIVRSYAFGPLPGGAVMITLTSHGGTCCVAVTLDPAAITDADAFLADLQAGFDEVLALTHRPDGVC